MTNNEILEKAFKKVFDNGFTLLNLEHLNYSFIIFSHSFAKAFWGESCYMDVQHPTPIRLWQYHLKQMVLEENPLEYLEKFL